MFACGEYGNSEKTNKFSQQISLNFVERFNIFHWMVLKSFETRVSMFRSWKKVKTIIFQWEQSCKAYEDIHVFAREIVHAWCVTTIVMYWKSGPNLEKRVVRFKYRKELRNFQKSEEFLTFAKSFQLMEILFLIKPFGSAFSVMTCQPIALGN